MTQPYYQDEHVTLLHGDCLDVLRELPDASVDAVVTDPPYGLEFMGKEWDRPWSGRGEKPAGADLSTGGFATGNGYSDRKTPTYGKPWVAKRCSLCGHTQAGGSPCRCDEPQWVIERQHPAIPMRAFQDWCEQWATECLRVLKPGGHLLAFGGSRTWHRLACAVEDAGFEIRDSIAWLYAQGFPKSLDVSKAIDKIRRRDYVAAAVRLGMNIPRRNLDDWTKEGHAPGDKWWAEFRAHLPSDDWQALEREVVGSGKSGAASVAYVRQAPGEYDVTAPATSDAERWQGWGTALKPAFEPVVVARKPLAGTIAANVLAHGTGALNVDACRVQMSDEDRRVIESMGGFGSDGYQRPRTDGTFMSGTPNATASKAHAAGRWPTNVVLDDATAAELDRQSGESRDGVAVKRNGVTSNGVTGWGAAEPGTPDAGGYGGRGGASRFFPTFRYEAKAPTAERPKYWAHDCDCPHDEAMRPGGTCETCGAPGKRIAHPTVKPLDYMRWLVRLVTPPGGTVLEPFAGSGTTAEACVVEGFRCIAIEREADYLPLIVARLTKPIQVTLDLDGGVA